MIKSCQPVAGVVLLAEKVRIEERVGLIKLSGECVRIHGKDILNVHLIGYSNQK